MLSKSESFRLHGLGRASLLEELLKVSSGKFVRASFLEGTLKVSSGKLVGSPGDLCGALGNCLCFGTILWFPQKLPVGSSEFVGRTFESFFRQTRSSVFVEGIFESFFRQIRWLSRWPLWGPWICVTKRKWAISRACRRGLKRTNDRERSNSLLDEVIGEGGPRATRGSTGGCRRDSWTMTNGPNEDSVAERWPYAAAARGAGAPNGHPSWSLPMLEVSALALLLSCSASAGPVCIWEHGIA